MRHVIIGNSTAAIGAVEAVRSKDKAGNIVIISNEPHHTYSRPLISYLLAGKTTEEKMKYRGADFYKDNCCELLLGKTVVKLDAAKKEVVLDNGSSVAYDKLLVATGSTPFVPPVKGLDTVKNKLTFTTLDDAHALEAALAEHEKQSEKRAKVLILGAGLIGLKCAEGVSKHADCVCVDLSPRILSSILDDESAPILQSHLEANNIKFILGQQITELNKNTAAISDGTSLPFDILVLAVGVRANISLVKDAGGETNRGILIDEHCKTTLPDIYAAGDCSESTDVSTGEHKVMALLPNAYMQGECAGLNMAEEDTVFNKAIPMNAIGFFGTHVITAGSYTGDVYVEIDEKNLKKLYFADNRLNGFILVGNIEKAGIYTSLIREQTPLDTIDFALICKKPGLMAFSREVRAEKLGGIKAAK
ncbi:MAG: FAD-dependent oxidoreductase [Oscillospiraceae bacterium]|nr:FAD-dependent oxidoreductase [Oscillospiraceae bacterium]